jgi:hypothetical protein
MPSIAEGLNTSLIRPKVTRIIMLPEQMQASSIEEKVLKIL